MRDPKLTKRAKEMRRDMPEPERRMWHQLRAGRLLGIKFRRQKVIGPYIADFVANEPKLVIELDGETHAGREPQDAERTRYLRQQGYYVVRFSNREVTRNMDGVLLELIELILDMRDGKLEGSPPPPTPSPKGEGAI